MAGGIWGDGQRGGIFGAKVNPRLLAELERRAAQKRAFDEQAASLAPSKIPPREMPQSFDETLTGTIGDVVYGAPVIGPAALGLGARIGAAGQALQGKQGYSQALEDIQTKQENYRRLNPEISDSAQWAGSGLFAPAFGGSATGQIIGNAALGGADAAVRGGDPSLAAVAGGGIAGALHLPAIFGGVMARTANREMLSLAKKMTAEGVPRERIWQETGWFKAPDKEWKFEINDETSRVPDRTIDALTQNVVRGRKVAAADQILEHPELYAAYPELRTIDVDAAYATDYPDTRGFYDQGGPASIGGNIPPRIGVRVNALAGDEGPRSLMLHELQHPVQQIEDFARGGSPADYAVGPMFDKRARDLQGDLSKALTGDVSHPVKDLIRDAQYGDLNRTEAIARKHGFNTIGEALSFLKQQDEMRTPYGQYRRLAGEAEARNVQDRRNLTAEERRATPPWKTQDVPDEQQIVRFRSGGGAQESRAKVPAAGRVVSSRHNQPPKEGPVNPLSNRARDPRYWNPASATKLSMPWEEIQPVYGKGGAKLLPEQPFDWSQVKEGDVFVPLVGDRTFTGPPVIGYNDVRFENAVPSEGGAGFTRRARNPQETFWASDPGASSKLVNQITPLQKEGRNVFATTTAMAAVSGDYSLQTTRAAMEALKAQPLSDKGRAALYKAIDAKMKSDWGKDYPAVTDWPGMKNVTDEYWERAGKARTKFAKALDTKPMADLGGPDMGIVRKIISDPKQYDAPPLGVGRSIVRLTGPAEAIHGEDVRFPHSTYRSQSGPGKYVGTLDELIPGWDFFTDFAKTRPDLTTSDTQGYTFMRSRVFQTASPEWLDRIVNYARSPQGKKLGLAGAIAAGLLSVDEAQEMFGAGAGESPRL